MYDEFSDAYRLRDLSILRDSLSALEKAACLTIKSVKVFEGALEEVGAALRKVSSFTPSNTSAIQNAVKFEKSMRELRDSTSFIQYVNQIHRDVLNPVKQLGTPISVMERNERTRKKTFKKFEKRRDVAFKKAQDYDRRQKPIAESKTYGRCVLQRNILLESYKEMCLASKDSLECLVKQTAITTDAALKSYSSHTVAYLLQMTRALREGASFDPSVVAQTTALPTVPSLPLMGVVMETTDGRPSDPAPLYGTHHGYISAHSTPVEGSVPSNDSAAASGTDETLTIFSARSAAHGDTEGDRYDLVNVWESPRYANDDTVCDDNVSSSKPIPLSSSVCLRSGGNRGERPSLPSTDNVLYATSPAAQDRSPCLPIPFTWTAEEVTVEADQPPPTSRNKGMFCCEAMK